MGWRRLAEFVCAWLTAARPSPRRLAVLAGFLAGFPLFALLTRLGWAADALLFPRRPRTPPARPVFIVGNFRSGTTFLHRLLATDRATFTTMPLWEILFAPSRLAKRLLRPVFTRGGPAKPGVVHDVDLREPEEDDYLLLHLFSALTVGLAAGLPRLAKPFVRFDQEVPDRSRLMAFYARCVAKHLDEAPPGTRYLAKNPALTPKLATVFEFFPDARAIVLERDPREMLASLASMMSRTWRAVGVPLPDPRLNAFLEDMAGHWYQYPRALAARGMADRLHFVRYADLVASPSAVIEGIYSFLGEDVGPDLRATLASLQPRPSRHAYSLEAQGFDRDSVERKFADFLEENPPPPPGSRPSRREAVVQRGLADGEGKDP